MRLLTLAQAHHSRAIVVVVPAEVRNRAHNSSAHPLVLHRFQAVTGGRCDRRASAVRALLRVVALRHDGRLLTLVHGLVR